MRVLASGANADKNVRSLTATFCFKIVGLESCREKQRELRSSQDIAVHKNDVMANVMEDRLFSAPLSINLRWYTERGV